MRFAVLFSAAMLTFPLQLALTGWAADWLTGRYGSTPAWLMWFFVGIETYAATCVIHRIYIIIDVIQEFAAYYFEERKTNDAVVLTIYGIKILQLKGAGSESDKADLPEGTPRTYTYVEYIIEPPNKASENICLRFDASDLETPILETAIDQVLIILLARWIGFEIEAQIAVSAFLFVWLHFKNMPLPSGFGSMSGGLYYGFTCAHWMRTSLWKAFWVTAAAHALHNALNQLVGFLLPKLTGKLFPKKKDDEQS